MLKNKSKEKNNNKLYQYLYKELNTISFQNHLLEKLEELYKKEKEIGADDIMAFFEKEAQTAIQCSDWKEEPIITCRYLAELAACFYDSVDKLQTPKQQSTAANITHAINAIGYGLYGRDYTDCLMRIQNTDIKKTIEYLKEKYPEAISVKIIRNLSLFKQNLLIKSEEAFSGSRETFDNTKEKYKDFISWLDKKNTIYQHDETNNENIINHN